MSNDTVKQYADRDSLGLDKAGNYYSRHVQAMTAEGLFTKSDIAGELAFRDYEIDRLRADYEEVLADHRRLVREMDVMINGDGAAEQASLCDMLAQLKLLLKAREELREANKKQKSALLEAQKLCQYALPKFNWGASALDARAIELLNTAPLIVNQTLESLEKEKKQ